ncbi:MAG: hypothetical protein Q8936_08380 [Bacillota bacterium]|nr:hypothetical protein [Bacillota bacterium]
MKLSNQRILEDIQKLGEIAQKQLPVKVSYAIAKNISKIEAELKIYNNEREKLIDKYAEKDEHGEVIAYENGQVKFKKGCLKAWHNDISDLLTIENEIDIHKFRIDELNGINISPAEIKTIEYMIEE